MVADDVVFEKLYISSREYDEMCATIRHPPPGKKQAFFYRKNKAFLPGLLA